MRKLTCIFFALVMSLALVLAGCGQAASGQESGSTTASAASTESAKLTDGIYEETTIGMKTYYRFNEDGTYYAYFFDGGVIEAGTYEVQDKETEYREEGDDDTKAATLTAPQTIVTTSYQGNVTEIAYADDTLQDCNLGGMAGYRFLHHNAEYAYDAANEETPLAVYTFYADNKSGNSLTLYHDKTFIDYTGDVGKEGTWTKDSDFLYTLTDEDNNTTTLALDGHNATYGDKTLADSIVNQGEAQVINTYRVDETEVGLPMPIAIRIDCYDNATAKMVVEIAQIGSELELDKGTYELDSLVYTPTFHFEKLGDIVSIPDAYRRDWLVKYGTQPDTFYDPMVDTEPKVNPNAGQAFSGHYTLDTDGNTIDTTEYSDTVNGDSWVDDVVFPSGNVDPVYITDWEWMLDIFAKALEAEGITDGYGLSLYYPGYVGTGDLVSGFGGIGPTWYLDENGKCTFGATSDGFKAYLECMSTWYKNGWIDQRFDQRSSDAFYQIDNTTVRQGKVGAWLATPSELMSRIQTDSLETTKGAVVYTCASPINDKYGSADVQLKKPTCFSAPELISSSIVVTDKAKDKDLKLLCEFLDYLYSEEGLLLANGGLNKEQAAEAQDATYAAYGVDYGYDPVQGDDGKTLMKLTPKLYADEGDIRSAMTLGRMWRLSAKNRYVSEDTETYTHQRENWVKYEATGAIGAIVNGQLDSDQTATMQKLTNRIGAEYMYVEVPKFIKGTYNLTTDWDNFVSDLNKRDYQSLVDTYNEALNK